MLLGAIPFGAVPSSVVLPGGSSGSLALLTGLFPGPAPAAAQEVTPSDSAAVVLGTARELEAEGDADIAEALFRHILERFPDTPAAAEVRTRFADEEGRARVRLEENGDVELLVWSTVYGGWLGVAVPAMLGADAAEAYGLGLLVGAPVGFLSARAYGSGRTITDGHARAITLGGTWGTWQGLGWAQVLELGSDCFRDGSGQEFCEDSPSAEATFASMVGLGLVGIGVGGLVANRSDVTAGTSTLANVGALWGSAYGLAGGLIADVDDSDSLWALTLVGGNVGLASMALLGPDWDVSRSRARLISVAGLVGLLGGLGLDLLFQPESGSVAALIPTVTSTAGLVVGTHATRGMDDDVVGTAPGSGTGGPADLDGALVGWRDGGWRLGVPVPGVTLRPSPRGDLDRSTERHPRGDSTRGSAASHRLALRVSLFSARF